jgi:acylphosphatase
MHCLHFWVSGRVQGVFFRAATREQALRLGLLGWVRNLRDGRVEVLACGGPEALEKLRRWVGEGPEMARVERVETREEEMPPDLKGFEVR